MRVKAPAHQLLAGPYLSIWVIAHGHLSSALKVSWVNVMKGCTLAVSDYISLYLKILTLHSFKVQYFISLRLLDGQMWLGTDWKRW